MDDRTLFDMTPVPYTEAGFPVETPARSPGSHRPTSIAAATVGKSNAITDRIRIREFVQAQLDLGATREEISERLGIKLQTVCFRVRELVKACEIFETERTRLTRSGARAFILVGNRPRAA